MTQKSAARIGLTALDATKWRSPTIQIADKVGGACGRQSRTDARMHNQRPRWSQDHDGGKKPLRM